MKKEKVIFITVSNHFRGLKDFQDHRKDISANQHEVTVSFDHIELDFLSFSHRHLCSKPAPH